MILVLSVSFAMGEFPELFHGTRRLLDTFFLAIIILELTGKINKSLLIEKQVGGGIENCE